MEKKRRGVEKLPYKTKRVHILVEEELYQIIEDYCKAEEKSITSVINSAIEDFIDNTKIDKYWYEYKQMHKRR